MTRHKDIVPLRANGKVVSDPVRDLLRLVVVERHKATGKIAKGLVKEFGLKSGALATSVAHDSHNILSVGVEDRDIYAAVKAVEEFNGGIVAVRAEQVLASLALPIAGLLSIQPVEDVAKQLRALDIAVADLGCTLPSPFSVLSFLALPVIPDLKLTDLGLVDVLQGRLVA